MVPRRAPGENAAVRCSGPQAAEPEALCVLRGPLRGLPVEPVLLPGQEVSE